MVCILLIIVYLLSEILGWWFSISGDLSGPTLDWQEAVELGGYSLCFDEQGFINIYFLQKNEDAKRKAEELAAKSNVDQKVRWCLDILFIF